MPVHRHPVAISKGNGPLANLPIDRELVGRLQEIFAQVREAGLRFGDVFYRNLFDAAPHLRPLFRGDPQSQTQKLVASLDAIVRNMLDPDENAVMLAALGVRHAGYGVKPEHYDLAIDLLIESMREVLGPLVPQQRLNEWRLALRLVSDQMIAAAGSPLMSSAPDAQPRTA